MTTLLSPSAQRSTDHSVLDAIRDEACNLAIWERSGAPAFDTLLASPLDDVRFAATLSELGARLTAQLGAAGYPATPARAALIADIAALAERYAAVMEIDAVSVRLAIVTTNSCRKFHADYVKARLITTYVGTGTQWLDAEDAARVARDEEPHHIRTLKAGDVGLFKGRMWTTHPAIHRSPPIADTGEKRLLLVLDPVRDAAG
ncbi:MAG: DUF1826 domain-containing protein [Erythrobacter sp.]|uniref:DUF1826 domain-containing protein n=1 Tax=Erythrobacter sp. TaxID=1042 RepID=UPI002621B9EC|nr:DUF1826 domain-containing protein [Erythrobacter sp.]MDJ0978542.1 DUF1826 domain-containing protein [Erythrobacter sp.]